MIQNKGTTQLGAMDQPSWPVPSYYCPSPIIMEGFDDICRLLFDDDADQQMEEILTDHSYIWSPSVSKNSSDACASYVPYETQSCIVREDDAMETESCLGLENLLMALAEAMGLGQIKLADVIQNCVRQKASPVGLALERLALNLAKRDESQEEEYLKQEAMRNFKTAFTTFYTVFPYGRFAHFTANSAITEEVPPYVETIHIVDFDLCEGSQWPPIMEAMAQMNKSLIIISVKPNQDHGSQFEQTKRQLCSFARSFGLNLKVQETDMSQIGTKMEGQEFVVFNCMVNLPHMGRTRNRNEVTDFIKLAGAVLARNKGIITFGDGEEHERMKNSWDFSSFFNKNLTHYKALYESMEWGFPSNLGEARMTMETLFVAPFISSKSWLQKWEDEREHTAFQMGLGLKGRPMSRESFDEARELVKEGESPYGIRLEGVDGNEMVLEWKGTPLVRVSAWM